MRNGICFGITRANRKAASAAKLCPQADLGGTRGAEHATSVTNIPSWREYITALRVPPPGAASICRTDGVVRRPDAITEFNPYCCGCQYMRPQWNGYCKYTAFQNFFDYFLDKLRL